MERKLGIIKWFNQEKGFGVATQQDQRESFIHRSQVRDDPANYVPGKVVVYVPVFDQKSLRINVKNCQLFALGKEWALLIDLINSDDSIQIELGNALKTISIKEEAVKQYLIQNGIELTLQVIKDSFGEFQIQVSFDKYCELLENIFLKSLGAKSAIYLKEIFDFFGQNLDKEMLFDTWKTKKLYRLGYAQGGDYEIPETLIGEKEDELGTDEWIRIREFSYGQGLVLEYLQKSSYSEKNLNQLENLIRICEGSTFSELGKIKEKLNGEYVKKYLSLIESQFCSLYNEEEDVDLKIFEHLIKNISTHISKDNQKLIRNRIESLIFEKFPVSTIIDLWQNDILDQVPMRYLMPFFEDPEAIGVVQIQILDKVSLDQKLEIVINFSKAFGERESINLIKMYLKFKNPIKKIRIKETQLSDSEFWEALNESSILFQFQNYLNENLSEEKRLDLFFEGILEQAPHSQLIIHYPTFNRDQWEKLFYFNVIDSEDLSQWYLRFLEFNPEGADWIYVQAKENLSEAEFEKFDHTAFDLIDPELYFNLWKDGNARITPIAALPATLKDSWDDYQFLVDCIERQKLSKEDAISIFLDLVSINQKSENRIAFKRIEYSLKAIHYIGLDQIKNSIIQNSPIAKLILWANDMDPILNFEMLRGKFIYFYPDKQVEIVKKLFYLKAIGQFDLTVEKLSSLTKFDLDLYLINQKMNPGMPIDISTDLIIKLLESIHNKREFLFESDLITLVLRDIMVEKTHKFKLDQYFERCKGRMEVKYNWGTYGTIRKIKVGANEFFAINIPLKIQNWHGEEFQNPNFQNSLNAVRELPNRTWDVNQKVWKIPIQFEEEVNSFAKENRFLFDFGLNNYSNNPHLAEFKRSKVPQGLSFCEGRISPKKDSFTGREFWWCRSGPCYENCETIHIPDGWRSYTLIDFLVILNINSDEVNRMGDLIPRGKFYKFIATVNRFNRLLEKLYCRDCDEILHPVDIAHYAAYGVVRFQCANKNCENHEEVYLNHCLNKKCESIIDSRDSKKCPNGLYVCGNCESCCSHKQLKNRLENLISNGAYIHPQLQKAVDKKLGHLERGVHFCHRCGGRADEIEHETYYCKTCDIQYDLSEFKFDRNHKSLPSEPSDFSELKPPKNDSDFDLEDLF